jgi:phosphatidylglycerol lysyltransferase
LKKINKKNLFLILKMVIPIFLLSFIFFEGRRFVGDIDVSLLKKHINDLNSYKISIILLIGTVGVLTMSLYDYVFTLRLRMKIPLPKLLQYSFISNSAANLFGFGGFAGAALRVYFYQDYKKNRIEVLKGIAELSVFYLSGLSVLCWLFIIGIFHSSVLNHFTWLIFVIWGIALYLPAMLIGLVYTKRVDIFNKTERVFLYRLVSISVLEWLFVFITFYTIASVLGISISFFSLLSLGVVGASAGLVSMIPGGLGSFDFIMLVGLRDQGIMEEQAILLLLLYRISYYLFPFVVSVIMLSRYFWKKINEKWVGVPNAIIGNISHFFVTFLVFISGVILLISSSFPAMLERIKYMHHILSIPLMNLSQQLSIAVGISLLGLARGIEYRVKRAYSLAFVMLVIGAIFTFSKSFNYEEAFFVLLVAFVLWQSRDHFYRKNFVYTWGRMLTDLFVIIVVLGFYLVIGYAYLPKNPIKIPEKFREFIFTEPSDLWLSGILGFFIACGILLIAYWIKRPEKFLKQETRNEVAAILDHLGKYGGTVLSHLMFLHDKAIFWSKDSKVLFSYQTIADKIVVLGDPVGEKAAIYKSIEELRSEADQFGYTPIYYQVSKEMLPYLHENGYDFLKLGEEGYVDLDNFSLSGNKMKNLRACKNKYDKKGFDFEVITPPFSKGFLNELKVVSDHWLGGRSEKGFSLGYFEENYLSLGSIAIVRNHEGSIITFASLMPVYGRTQIISVDLMRYMPDSPNGIMDYTFIHLIEWSKQAGYQLFNLGMAPLANVGLSKYSFLSEKIAAQIYSQGHMFYHFQGVRRFKEKYAVIWEPKYLAYKRKTSLLFTMIQLTYLISRNKK